MSHGRARIEKRLVLRRIRTESAQIADSQGPEGRESPVVNTYDREVLDMESTFDRAASLARTQMTKMRWVLGLNGLFSVIFGVVIIIWPGLSLFALTILFGVYALATGVVGVAAAFTSGHQDERGWLVASSLLGIVTGLLVLVWPSISELALLYVIAAYAVALGIIAIGGTFYLPLDGTDTALLALSGLASILFGAVMFAKPGAGALVVLALIAAFAVVTGITELVVAIGGERLIRSSIKRTPATTPQPS
jgi:uncharacterized membrane protein HdeD (DUF308 family)